MMAKEKPADSPAFRLQWNDSITRILDLMNLSVADLPVYMTDDQAQILDSAKDSLADCLAKINQVAYGSLPELKISLDEEDETDA